METPRNSFSIPAEGTSRLIGTAVDAYRARELRAVEAASSIGAIELSTTVMPVEVSGASPEPPVSRVRSNMGRRSAESTEVPPVSRVRYNMGRKFTESTSLDTGVTEDGSDTSAELAYPKVTINMGRDTSVVAAGDSKVPADDGSVSYLEKLLSSSLVTAAKEHGFATAFGGGLNLEGDYHLSPRAQRAHPYRTDLHGRIPPQNGFSKPLETGANIGKLIEKAPFDRFKFYLSLDLSTPEKKERAQGFLDAVYERAAEKKLSMLTKSEDHNYDSCNIYTWNPEEFSTIIAELHDSYPDIWLPVEHPLQGPVGNVDPMHVGMVQEPILGFRNGSHSARGADIGRYIDESGGELTPEGWQQACKKAGVLPDKPWLIDPGLKDEYLSRFSSD